MGDNKDLEVPPLLDTVGRPPRSSRPSTPASPSTSSSFPSNTSPHTSHFRSLSSPMSTSFISASMNTDFVHMSTNYQFTGCQISGISTENISLSSGRCKNLSARRDIRIATPSSSSLPSSTTPSTSCFRSFSSPTDASFASSSWDAATVHMGTNHQLTGSHIRGISTANISLSSRRKLSSDQERPQNEADPSPVPSSTVESEKARLRRASQERDRAQAEIQSNRSRSLSTHVYPTPQTSLERGIHANISLTYCARNAAPCKQVSGRSSF